MRNKIKIIIGLGQKVSGYRSLSKYLDIVQPDWNNGSLSKMRLGKPDTLVGFSLGCMIACMHAEKHKVKTLVLCSLSPGAETLKTIKADEVIFLVGEKEKWVTKEAKRVAKTLKCKWQMKIIPKADHKIDKNYQKVLLQTVFKQ